MSLEQVLNPQSEESVVQPEAQAQEQSGGQPEGVGEPTSPETQGTHVPLAALEAERKGRQDWKEKAIRFEEELKQLRQNAQQQQFSQMDPVVAVQQQVINERFNTSEMLARQTYKDLDDKVNVFMEAAKANPALSAALHQQRHPWEFAYKEGARMLMLKEVGDDPAAYRAKVEAEIRAQLQSQAQPQVSVPSSLNGARSVAPRSANAWTGPTPLNDFVGNR